MQKFQVVNREFVPEMDLNLVNAMFNKRETLHNEAIKASSEIKRTLAQLNLNEAEDAYKAQLTSDIERTLEDNSTLNDYAASYDDMIKLTGDILSNPGLIGRLKAQEDYQKYQAQVDAMNMPEDYKQYFKENNPYYYSDKYDRAGNIIGGTKWEANKTPTTIVPLDEIVDKGIKRAAYDKGQGTITRWLDKDGKVTTDPTKVFDGEIYNVTTNSYERLGHDKILQSIYAVIEETPGAKESLDQDYEIAKWKHDKYAEESNELTVSDITDENGNVLSPEEYLLKRIDPAAHAAAYDRKISQTTYGSGLASYKKAQAIKDGLGGGNNRQTSAFLDASFRNTPITFKYNKGQKSYELKNNLANDITKTLSSLGINPASTTYEDLEQAIDNIPINKQTQQLHQDLNYKLMLYKEVNDNLELIRKGMSDNDRARFDYSNRMLNGGQMLSSANGGSAFDDQVINNTNKLFDNASEVRISFADNTTLSDFLKTFSSATDLRNLGIEIHDNYISVNRDNKNVIPMLANHVNIFNDRNKPSILSPIPYVATVTAYDANGNDMSKYLSAMDIGIEGGSDEDMISTNYMPFRALGNLYQKADKFSKKYEDKYDISEKEITVGNISLYGENFDDTYTTNLYNLGLIDLTEKNRRDKAHSEYLDNELKNFNAKEYSIYNADGKITDSKDILRLQEAIKLAAKEGRLEKTNSVVPGVVDEFSGLIGGYTLNIYPTKDKKDKQQGSIEEIYIPGLGGESYLQELNKDPKFQIVNTLSILNETKEHKYITTSRMNPILGDVVITGLGNNLYNVEFGNTDFMLPKAKATDFYMNVLNYNLIKNSIRNSGLPIKDVLTENERMANSLDNISENISELTGINPLVIDSMISSDLQN